MRFLTRVELGVAYPCNRPFAFATFIPSRVRNLIRSDSNSAVMAKHVEQQPANRIVGSYTEPPMWIVTCRAVSSSSIALA